MYILCRFNRWHINTPQSSVQEEGYSVINAMTVLHFWANNMPLNYVHLATVDGLMCRPDAVQLRGFS